MPGERIQPKVTNFEGLVVVIMIKSSALKATKSVIQAPEQKTTGGEGVAL